MTGAAKIEERLIQKRPLRRRMGVMTIETPVFPDDGQMETVFGEHVVDHGVMATPAQFKTLLFQGKRVRRTGAFVAEIACLIGKGRMGRIIYQSRPVGAVRAVTHGAAAVAHGIINVLFDKNGLVDLMTAFAERRYLLFQESAGLRGPMRIVTADALFLHRVVLELGFRNRVHLIFMAVVAQLVAALEQIVLVLRGMGIVALDALAFQCDFVQAARVLRQYPTMAGEADPAHFGRQLFRKVRRMGAVTGRTSRFNQRRVDKRFFQFFLEVGVARQADLSLGVRFQPEFAFLAFPGSPGHGWLGGRGRLAGCGRLGRLGRFARFIRLGSCRRAQR